MGKVKIFKQGYQEIIISFDANKQDIKTCLELAKYQSHHNWHFFSKKRVDGRTVYSTQSYTGNYPRIQYYGWVFEVAQDGKIINQY